jgi:hypothetical protein
MHDELKFFGLAPLFGVLGGLATAAAWQLFAVTILDLVPSHLTVLACLVAGLGGPVVVWLAVWIAIHNRQTPIATAIGRSASVGLGLVLAAEIGFYIPLGFFAIAYA